METLIIPGMKTRLPYIVFIAWVVAILMVFFASQPSAVFVHLQGVFSLLSTIIYGLIFAGAGVGLGYSLLGQLWTDDMGIQRFSISAGFGMGLLGLLGFILAGVGLGNGWLMLSILVSILAWLVWKGYVLSVFQDLLVLRNEVSSTAKDAPRWILWIAPCFLFLSFVLALGPRTEAFDGLLYHLANPSWWIRDGGITSINMFTYWFPSLMEGMYVWPLSAGLDLTPQLIHLLFALLCVLLTWDWTRLLLGGRAAWWSLVLVLSMPSMPLLATWSYTDFGLIFYSLAALAALSNWSKAMDGRWILVCGSMAGFAMGIKYTSFILPVTIVLCLVWLLFKQKELLPGVLARFVGMSILSGFPWYLRNLIWTGNPIYPFVFGGVYWDTFRADWYSNLGTGIGWSVARIFSLPLTVTIGTRDLHYVDGRIGPFYLILFPITVLALASIWRSDRNRFRLFMFPLVFFVLSAAFWILGVIQTRELMQARLLWSALIPLLPLMAAGILYLESRSTSILNYGSVFSAFAAITLCILLLEFLLFVVDQTPIRVTLGFESREDHMARTQPDYSQELLLVNQTPSNSFVYLLYEPRSFGMDRRVQPDADLDNFSHDLYVYPTNDSLLSSWERLGYTHLLARKYFIEEGQAGYEKFSDAERTRIRELLARLKIVAETEDFILFSIP